MKPNRSRKFPQKSPGQPSPAQSLASRIAALEEGQRVLTEASDTNAKAFSDCFYALEARQWIIMRVLDDIASDGRPVADRVSGKVDWPHYEAAYKKYIEIQEEKKQVAEAFPEADTVFGGGG